MTATNIDIDSVSRLSSYVPFLRNKRFIKRDEILSTLIDILFI
jgi:hypothetical protein